MICGRKRTKTNLGGESKEKARGFRAFGEIAGKISMASSGSDISVRMSPMGGGRDYFPFLSM